MGNSRAAWLGFALGGAVVVAAPLPLLAQEQGAPLSAIDWLSDTITVTAPLSPNASRPVMAPFSGEAPVAGGLAPAAAITTTVLGGPSLDAVGLLSPATTGFPRALWGTVQASDVAGAIAALQPEGIPALQTLALKLLLAEADAPIMANAGEKGAVLLARIDKLLAMGALDQAYALIEAAGTASTADLIRRAFDTSLLMGEEDRACRDIRAAKGVAIAAPTRIFCAARAGDWTGARLTLGTETALGRLGPVESELLARFLDPGAFDDETLPPVPSPVTPLIWRIYDALGETLPTGTLPLAFAHAELTPRAGWKAQAEAAERLARAGVLQPNQLLGIFTAQKPAASGGIWDRIAAFQAFETAYKAKDTARIAATLAPAYAAMKSAELEVPFAALFAEGLAEMALPSAVQANAEQLGAVQANAEQLGAVQANAEQLGAMQPLAYELGLLSPAYERLATQAPPTPREAFLAGLARGDVAGLPVSGELGRAVAAGFSSPALPDDLALLATSGEFGMGVLAAIARIQTGVLGEDRAVTEGLALLRKLGLESAARRTALELMILERRG